MQKYDTLADTLRDTFLTRGAHSSVYQRDVSTGDSTNYRIVKKYHSIPCESDFYRSSGEFLADLSPKFTFISNDEIEFSYLSTDTLFSILVTKSFSQLTIHDLAISILSHINILQKSVHQLCVLHRNLEPKHIIVDIKNNGVSTQLIDYTYAIATNTDKYFRSELNQIYRAPEMNEGKEGTTTDIWSFGAILYEMFTRGVPLFDTVSVAMSREDKTSLIQRKIARLNLVKSFPQTWDCWESILKKCLVINPNNRINCLDLLAELNKLRATNRNMDLDTQPLRAQLCFRGNFLFYKQGYLIEQLIFFLESYETDKITRSDTMYVYILLYYVYSSIKSCVFQLYFKYPTVFAKSRTAFQDLPYDRFENKVYSYVRKLQNGEIKKRYPELNVLEDPAYIKSIANPQAVKVPQGSWNLCYPTDENCLDFMRQEWNIIQQNVYLHTFATRISQIMHCYDHYQELTNQKNIKLPMQAQWIAKATNLQKKLKAHLYRVIL